MRFKAILVVAALASSGFAVALPVRACGNCSSFDERVLAPRAADIAERPRSYYVEFVGRSSADFGHSFVRLGIVTTSGQSRRIMDFGLYPADASGGKLAALFGTRAAVGYSTRDVRDRPAVVVRAYVDTETHRYWAGSIGRLSRIFPRFEVLHVNCNNLTGYVARKLGLRVPANTVQRGDDFVAELKALNMPASRR